MIIRLTEKKLNNLISEAIRRSLYESRSLLTEATRLIGHFGTHINGGFHVLLFNSEHADEREKRYMQQGGGKISDHEIQSTFERAIFKIDKWLDEQKIALCDRFIIYEPNSELNIVASVTRDYNQEENIAMKISVITVYRGDDFNNPANTPVMTL